MKCPLCRSVLPASDFLHECNNGSITTSFEQHSHKGKAYQFLYQLPECSQCFSETHESTDWPQQIQKIADRLAEYYREQPRD